jgi:N-acyl-L-homoserine lactone synthetase
MIIIIDALNKHTFGHVLEEMHKLRARVFQDRLGWDVSVKNDMERDLFDDLNPAHVVCLDEDGDVVGCMRLLQTTGPHMLSDVFYDILDGEPPLRSAQIWEATRFCVDTQKLKGGKTRNSISYVTSEVMIGAFEYALKAGVLDAIAVIDPVMSRVLKRSGNAPYDYLGSAKPMGKVTAMAALMDCSDTRISGIRAFSGITHDVFASEETALARIDQRTQQHASEMQTDTLPTQTEIPSDLAAYFGELMRQADSPAEMDSVRRLRDAVTSQRVQDKQQPLRILQ